MFCQRFIFLTKLNFVWLEKFENRINFTVTGFWKIIFRPIVVRALWLQESGGIGEGDAGEGKDCPQGGRVRRHLKVSYFSKPFSPSFKRNSEVNFSFGVKFYCELPVTWWRWKWRIFCTHKNKEERISNVYFFTRFLYFPLFISVFFFNKVRKVMHIWTHTCLFLRV